MYPRINPKTNNFCVKTKNSLSIIENDFKSKMSSNSKKTNSYLDEDIKANKFFKVKTLVEEKEKEEAHSRFQRFESKQNNRHSSCIHQLPEKFNHLRGKRRSLQMALMLYQQIQDQKCEALNNSAESRKKRKSDHNFSHSSNKKKSSLHCLDFTRIFDEQNENLQKYELSTRSRQQFKQPLTEIENYRKNQLMGQNEEYNFVGKSMKKRSFFKNRILDQILQNNIDQWQYETTNDQNEIFTRF